MKIYEVVEDDGYMVTVGLFSTLDIAKSWISEKISKFDIYETEVDGGKGLDSSRHVYANYGPQ